MKYAEGKSMIVNTYEEFFDPHYWTWNTFEKPSMANITLENICFSEKIDSAVEITGKLPTKTTERGFLGRTRTVIGYKYESRPIKIFKIHMVCGKTIYCSTDPLEAK